MEEKRDPWAELEQWKSDFWNQRSELDKAKRELFAAELKIKRLQTVVDVLYIRTSAPFGGR